MKVCVRENYVDVNVLNRISESELKKEPYNFQIVEIPDDRSDCFFADFDMKRKKFVFNEQKYQKRKECELAEKEMLLLKQFLAETDYKAIKFAEGEISQDEFSEAKIQRRKCREKINELEKIINGGTNE